MLMSGQFHISLGQTEHQYTRLHSNPFTLVVPMDLTNIKTIGFCATSGFTTKFSNMTSTSFSRPHRGSICTYRFNFIRTRHLSIGLTITGLGRLSNLVGYSTTPTIIKFCIIYVAAPINTYAIPYLFRCSYWATSFLL